MFFFEKLSDLAEKPSEGFENPRVKSKVFKSLFSRVSLKQISNCFEPTDCSKAVPHGPGQCSTNDFSDNQSTLQMFVSEQ